MDNFLPPGSLLEDLSSEKLWEGSTSATWLPRGINPKGPVESLVYDVWNNLYKVQEAEGYEYWVNELASEPPFPNTLNWHLDKDEELNSATESLSTPVIGMVYYAHTKTPVGGYLEVAHSEEPSDIERIRPLPNRLVLLEVGNYLHRVSPVVKGIRRTIASNVWMKKPGILPGTS